MPVNWILSDALRLGGVDAVRIQAEDAERQTVTAREPAPPPDRDERRDDRLRGALFGLAIGDALDAAVEFRVAGSFEPVTGLRDGGPHGLAAGEWTDDTSTALALADSIAHVGWDLNDQAAMYVAWWRSGQYSVNGRCFDIGLTTRSALARFERTGDARTSGDRSEHASGNGSIMRLVPGADPLQPSVSGATG